MKQLYKPETYYLAYYDKRRGIYVPFHTSDFEDKQLVIISKFGIKIKDDFDTPTAIKVITEHKDLVRILQEIEGQNNQKH